MTEEELKQLMQKSIIKTSDDFTDNLMQKIDTQAQAEKEKVVVLPSFNKRLLILSIIMIISSRIAYLILKKSAIIDISVSKTPLFLGFVLAFLFALNYLLKMKQLVVRE